MVNHSSYHHSLLEEDHLHPSAADLPANQLILIETDQEIIVAWGDDPQDWLARFQKTAGFPARHWAERMRSLFIAGDQHLGVQNHIAIE